MYAQELKTKVERIFEPIIDFDSAWFQALHF